jgi:hypothetical protein
MGDGVWKLQDLEPMKIDGFDQKLFNEDFEKKWKEEFPKMKEKMKDLEQNFQFELSPEFEQHLEDLKIARPRVERRPTPAPAPKPNK